MRKPCSKAEHGQTAADPPGADNHILYVMFADAFFFYIVTLKHHYVVIFINIMVVTV